MHPKDTSHIIGHEAQEQQLLQMIESGKMPSTLLFSGEMGIGKASFAYRLIRYLLAPESERPSALFGPTSLEIPPDSATFSRVASEAHSDLLVLAPEVDPKTGVQKHDIKVDAARKVGAFLSLTPAESDWRIVLIDSACILNLNAANALLKAIEEPPKNALMILLSHNSGKLLPTIRSRCHTLQFSPPNKHAFYDIVKMHHADISDERSNAYYHISHASPGFAVTLMKEEADKHYHNLLLFSANGETALDTLAFAESANQKKGQLAWEIWQHLYQLLFQRCLRLSCEEALDEIFPGEKELLRSIASSHSPERLIEMSESIAAQCAATQQLHLDKKQTMLQSIRTINP